MNDDLANAPALAQALVDAAIAAYDAGLDGDSETEPYITVELLVPMSIALAIRDNPKTLDTMDTLLVDPFCRVCGCTDKCACDGGCYWVEPDLCSSCVPRVPLVLAMAEAVV